MEESRIKPIASVASQSTVGHKTNNSTMTIPRSPLSQRPLFPPSYDEASVSQKPSSQSKERWIKAKNITATLLKKYWFLLGLAFVIILAYLAPDVARKDGYIHAEWSIKWGSVIVIFLISGLSLRTRILTQTFMRIRLHLLVQFINLAIIPSFVFGFVLLLFRLNVPMNSLVLMGVVIAASTPTTVSSNVVMTKSAKGNEATALMNAALGNVLGIFISPVLVDTFQEPLVEATPENEQAEAGGAVDFVSVLKQLGITVLVPLVVGQVIQLAFTDKVADIKVKWRLSDVSSVCLLTMVWSVFSDAFHAGSFNSVSATDIVAVLIMNAAFYTLFSLLALCLAYIPFPASIKEPNWVRRLRYSREDTVAVMYCGATKTVAMGVPLINVLYENGDPGTIGVLSTPLLLYHVEQLILGNLEIDLLKRWVSRGKQHDQESEGKSGGAHRDEEDVLPSSRSQEEVHAIPVDATCPSLSPPPASQPKLNSGFFSHMTEKVAHEHPTPVLSPAQAKLATDRRMSEKHASLTSEELFNAPFFTTDTASISLDTSRFSTDTFSSSSPLPPPQHKSPSQRKSWYL
ncbi:SBF-like CPA transporter family-domain-containing protein [Dichotomocladium elegans]|nr:SBF-like CPA transporter family-domain-containing protein [Dichotomocladium elegans]